MTNCRKWLLSVLVVLSIVVAGANLSAVSAQAAPLTDGTYDETAAGIIYTAGWKVRTDGGAVGGSDITTTKPNGSARFEFSGSQITIIYSKTIDSGLFQVTIDATVYEFDAFSPAPEYQVQWISPVLTGGTHNVVIQKKDRDGKAIYFDGLIVSSAAASPAPTQDLSQAPYTPTPMPSLLPLMITATPVGPGSTPTLGQGAGSAETAGNVDSAAVDSSEEVLTTSSTTTLATPTSTGVTVNVYSGQSIMTRCVNAVSAGATCVVNTGTYNERVTINKALTVVCNGACVVTGGFNITGSYVTVRSFEVKTRGIMVAGAYNTIEKNYIHDLTYDDPGVLMYNASVNHIVVKNNRIYRANNSCIQTTGNSNGIYNNDCSNTKQTITNGDANCFNVFGGSHMFAGNRCHDLDYGAAGYNYSVGDYINDAHVDCFQTWNWVERGGAVHDSAFRVNTCDVPSKGGTATAKAFQLTGRTSSGTIDTTKPYPCRNLSFTNNVIHSNLYGIFNYCENLTFKNNTFVSDVISGTQGLHFFAMRGSNVIQYNIFVDADEGAFISLDAVSKPTLIGGYNVIYISDGVPRGTKLIGDLWDVDPRFVNRAAKDYHLQVGSPACGRGAYPC